jgi:hypothetical protein
MANKNDFIIGVTVDSKGVDTYLKAMGTLPERLKRVEQKINSMSSSGLSFRAGSSKASQRIRQQAERIRLAQRRTSQEMGSLSVELQADVARRVEMNLARPSAATGALKALTSSPRNRMTTPGFFGVGAIPFLAADKKVAYALAIEAGSRASLGRRLSGVWMTPGGTAIPFGAPSKDQRFVRMNSSLARHTLGGAGKTSGVVTRPILAHRSYRKSVQYFKPQQRTAAAIRRIYGFK